MRNQNIYILLLLLLSQMWSCTIEKRHYLSGFHIEKKWHNNISPNSLKQKTPQQQRTREREDEAKSIITEFPTQAKSDSTILNNPKDFPNKKKVNKSKVDNKKLVTCNKENQPSVFQELPKKRKTVHPDAYGSFLCGLGAFGSLLGIFIMGLSPLWLFVVLLIVLLVLGFLASKLSRRAFKDMQYARDRYSGKALAVAGMIMGILSLIALIGILAITLLGIAFINLT